ncbi:MAG: gliding motility protein GldM [Bacteroidales bacterium]
MAGGKQTPRQKMIGMMYLVLTALLALNVSKEVLNAFIMVDDGLQQTNRNFGQKVEMVYQDFEQQKALAPNRVEPFYSQAQEVREYSEELVNHILDSRSEMIAFVDGLTKEEADTLSLINLASKDNYSASTAFWMLTPLEGTGPVANPGAEGTRAYQLKQMIEEYKAAMRERTPELFRDNIQLGLDTEGPFYDKNGLEVNWQTAMFDHQIPVAAATNLTRMVTEVKNAEFDVVNLLYAAITAEDYTFDTINAAVIPESKLVLLGDYFEAEVIVAAFDSKQKPNVTVNGQAVEDGKLRIPANSEGLQNYSGQVSVVGPAGVTTYDFEGDFVVQRPSATVSADAMNVFYMGVDNPVSVSVPGIPSGNIEPRISGAGNRLIPKAGGGYNVRLSQNHNVNQNVTITLFARMNDELRNMGASTFRVRVVPDPYPEIAGQKEGNIPKDVLAGQPIIPRMQDFDFQMDFRITSFTMNTTVAGDFQEWRSGSNLQTEEMEQAIRRSNRGQRFSFENIKAVGDDGRERNLPPMVFRIQ